MEQRITKVLLKNDSVLVYICLQVCANLRMVKIELASDTEDFVDSVLDMVINNFTMSAKNVTIKE